MKQDAFYLSQLCDIYGPLLTEKQRLFFDLYYNRDMSLGEIAEEAGTSRQSVHELLTRTEEKLRLLEQQLKLADRSIKTEKALDEIRRAAETLRMQPEAAPLAEQILLAADSVSELP